MSAGIRVGSIVEEIGEPSFLHACFSTVSGHCEPYREPKRPSALGRNDLPGDH